MDATNTPRTTRDALTIELLGDVGRLHDEIKALPERLKSTLSPALGAIALASVARELAASAKALDKAMKEKTRQPWQWIAPAFAGSLVVGALGFYGSYLLYGKQIDEEAAFGRAVVTVWGSLDAKTKERIQAARNSP